MNGFMRYFMLFASVFAITWILLASVAPAQIGNHNGHSKFHNWYQSQKQAGGASCCNDKDCRPIVRWANRNGVIWIQLQNKEWVRPPQDRIQWLDETPDDGSHACFEQQTHPANDWMQRHWYCILLLKPLG